MSLSKITLDINTVFNEECTLDLSKDKICIIGNIGTGKTTLLNAISKRYSGMTNYHARYVKVNESNIEYKIKIESDIKDNFLSDLEYLNVNVLGKEYSKEFECDQLIDEFKLQEINILDKYDKVTETIKEIITKFNNFCIENEVNENDFFVTHSTYLNESYRSNPKNVMNESVFKNNNKITYRNSSGDLYNIAFPDDLIIGHRVKHLEEHYEDLHMFFSDFFSYGEPEYIKSIDEFNNNSKDLKDKLTKVIEEYNTAILKYNWLFGSYSQLHKYFSERTMKNTFLLDHSRNYENSRQVMELALRGVANIVYQDLYEYYEREILNDFDYGFYMTLKDLKVIDFETIINVELWENDEEIVKKFRKYIFDNHQKILNDLKDTLNNRDILKDYFTGTESYFEIFNHVPNYGWLMNTVEDYILDMFPKDIDSDVERFEITKDRSDRHIITAIGNYAVTLDELSAGTVWKLKFNLMKNLLTENDILLIDEPGLFLQVSLQREIVKEIFDLDCIVIYTTHTPSLLPLNLENSLIYEVKSDKGGSKLIKLDKDIKEEVIESFGLRYLQNVLVDYTREALLISPKISNIDNYCEVQGVLNDIPVLKGKLNIGILKKLHRILSSYGINVTVVVTKEEEYEELYNKIPGVEVYLLNKFNSLLSKNKEMELSNVLKVIRNV